MKYNPLRILALLLLFLTGTYLFSQEGSLAIIEYIEGDPYEVTVQLPSGELEEAYIGMELELGSTVKTGDANVEIALDPNGTIFNLGSGTVFVINTIQGRQESEETSMSLLSGRLRTVAARLGRENRYTINTPTSVCGIRGTEIFNTVSADENFIICKSGLVDVISKADPENRTQISGNMRVNTGMEIFTPLNITPEEVNAVFDTLPFRKLDPLAVPGQTVEKAADEDIQEDQEAPEEEPQAEEAEPEQPVQEISTPEIPAEPLPAAAEEDSRSRESREPTKLEQWFSDHMNFQLGSVTINGETWAQAIIQPVFITGKIRMGLYLPVIYRENFLDPGDWYHPEGNNEWSFGGDQSGWEDTLLDLNRDIWLKVRYFEFGTPGWDPFYLKAGNLDSMTLGHGSLVQNYSNNTNFPSVRMTGINTGITLGGLELEALVDDAADPSLMGGRIQIRSGKPFALGAASVVDLYPAAEAEDPEALGDPYLVGGSVDLEFFSINTDLLKLQTYLDASATIPIYRNQPEGTAFDTSDPFKLIWDDETLSNYGLKGGVAGKVTLLDFMVNIRYEDGLYRHNLFDNLYQRNRLSYLTAINGYLENPETTVSSVGLYGEGGFNLFQEKIRLSAAYLWPWEIDGSNITTTDDDYFKLGLELSKGLVPFYDISGAVYYERARFASSLGEGDFVWLNEDSILTGEVVLPVAPPLDLAMTVSSSTIYDEEGNLIMEDDGITPRIVPVFTIETRIHF